MRSLGGVVTAGRRRRKKIVKAPSCVVEAPVERTEVEGSIGVGEGGLDEVEHRLGLLQRVERGLHLHPVREADLDQGLDKARQDKAKTSEEVQRHTSQGGGEVRTFRYLGIRRRRSFSFISLVRICVSSSMRMRLALIACRATL